MIVSKCLGQNTKKIGRERRAITKPFCVVMTPDSAADVVMRCLVHSLLFMHNTRLHTKACVTASQYGQAAFVQTWHPRALCHPRQEPPLRDKRSGGMALIEAAAWARAVSFSDSRSKMVCRRGSPSRRSVAESWLTDS